MAVATLDEVTARSRELDVAAGARRFGRALLTVLAAVLFAVGWLAARVVTLTVAAALWSCAAVALGWREARPVRAGPT